MPRSPPPAGHGRQATLPLPPPRIGPAIVVRPSAAALPCPAPNTNYLRAPARHLARLQRVDAARCRTATTPRPKGRTRRAGMLRFFSFLFFVFVMQLRTPSARRPHTRILTGSIATTPNWIHHVPPAGALSLSFPRAKFGPRSVLRSCSHYELIASKSVIGRTGSTGSAHVWQLKLKLQKKKN